MSPAAHRDTRRRAVYAAEDQVAAVLDRGGRVDFHGSLLDLPAQRRFGNVADVQRYLDAIRELPWGFGTVPRPQVRLRASATRAHWRAPTEIAMPDSPWALRELVVLHEYAHHVAHHTGRGSLHDRQFCELHIELVSHAVDPQAGLLLLAAYTESGIFPGTQGIQPGSRRVQPA